MDEELNRAASLAIELADVDSAARLHERLREALALPPWYGCNWDAFWDAISGLVPMPRRLRLQGWSDFARRLPEEAAQLSACLEQIVWQGLQISTLQAENHHQICVFTPIPD